MCFLHKSLGATDVTCEQALVMGFQAAMSNLIYFWGIRFKYTEQKFQVWQQFLRIHWREEILRNTEIRNTKIRTKEIKPNKTYL